MRFGNSPSTIAPLTGIRGIAALWVVLCHMRNLIKFSFPDWPLLHRFCEAGYLGLDLFSFLSGFIIAYTYSEQLQSLGWTRVRRFVWLRFVRTYPLHLFILFLFVIALINKQGLGSLTTVPSDATFLRQVFLLHGFGLEDQYAWNLPSWSLSSEWVCYLAFPLLAPMLVRVRRGSTALALALATLMGTIACMTLLGYAQFRADLSWGVVRIGGEFLTGCWLYRVHRSGLLARWPLGWIGLLAIATVVAVMWVGTWELVAATSVTAFAVLVLCLAQNQQPLRMLFGNRVMLFLGEISYSVYMLHWLVLNNGQQIGFPSLPPRWRIAAILTTILVGATISFFTVEQPTRRLLRNFSLIHPGRKPLSVTDELR